MSVRLHEKTTVANSKFGVWGREQRAPARGPAAVEANREFVLKAFFDKSAFIIHIDGEWHMTYPYRYSTLSDVRKLWVYGDTVTEILF